MRSTHRQRQFRLVKILSLNDANVYAHPDHGPGKDGGNTTSRGQLLGMLDKVEKVDGKMLPIFLLAEPPETLFGPDHEFDRKHLKDKRSGEWLTPTPEWLAERARRSGVLEHRKARSRQVAARYERDARRDAQDAVLAQPKPVEKAAEKPVEKPAKDKQP